MVLAHGERVFVVWKHLPSTASLMGHSASSFRTSITASKRPLWSFHPLAQNAIFPILLLLHCNPYRLLTNNFSYFFYSLHLECRPCSQQPRTTLLTAVTCHAELCLAAKYLSSQHLLNEWLFSTPKNPCKSIPTLPSSQQSTFPASHQSFSRCLSGWLLKNLLYFGTKMAWEVKARVTKAWQSPEPP